MTEASLARSAPESTRESRGLALYRERWAEIEYKDGSWFVPSATDAGSTYAVRLGPVPVCECADHAHRGAHCLHIHAATVAHAKSVTCSCCGSRVPRRLATEVEEDHELLSWFVGDVICAACIGAGYWA